MASTISNGEATPLPTKHQEVGKVEAPAPRRGCRETRLLGRVELDDHDVDLASDQATEALLADHRADEEAQVRATSAQQAFVNLRSGRPAKLPPPLPGYRDKVGPAERALLDSVLSCSTTGSPETVRRGLQDFIDRTGADELMIASQMFDHSARLRSYEIAAELRKQLA